VNARSTGMLAGVDRGALAFGAREFLAREGRDFCFI
jgi:hypothetical protein